MSYLTFCQVTVHKNEGGNFNNLGQAGVAVMGTKQTVTATSLAHLLLYRADRQNLCTADIVPNFGWTVQDNGYANFYDNAKQNWSVHFKSDDESKKFAMHVALAKFWGSTSPNVTTLDLLVPKAGKGVLVGDTVAIKFSIWSVDENGKIVSVTETNTNSNNEFKLTLGDNSAAGYTEGIVGMKKGGKRICIIPSHLVYGRGSKKDPLVLEVEVAKLKRGTAPSTTSIQMPNRMVDDDDSGNSDRSVLLQKMQRVAAESALQSDQQRMGNTGGMPMNNMGNMGMNPMGMNNMGMNNMGMNNMGMNNMGMNNMGMNNMGMNNMGMNAMGMNNMGMNNMGMNAMGMNNMGMNNMQGMNNMGMQGMNNMGMNSPPSLASMLPQTSSSNALALYTPPSPNQNMYGSTMYMATPTQPIMQPTSAVLQSPSVMQAPAMIQPQNVLPPQPVAPPTPTPAPVIATSSATETVQALMEESEFRTELRSNLAVVFSRLDEVSRKVEEFKVPPGKSGDGTVSGQMIIHTLQRLVDENERHRLDVNDRTEAIDVLKKKIAELQDKNERLLEENTRTMGLQNQLEVVQKTKSQVELEMAAANLASSKIGTQMQQIKAELSAKQDELQTLQEQLKTSRGLIESLTDEKAKLEYKAQRAEQHAEEDAEMIKKIKGKRDDLEKLYEETAEKLTQAEKDLETTKAKQASAIKKAEKAIQQEKDELQEKIDKLEKTIEKLKKGGDMDRVIAENDRKWKQRLEDLTHENLEKLEALKLECDKQLAKEKTLRDELEKKVSSLSAVAGKAVPPVSASLTKKDKTRMKIRMKVKTRRFIKELTDAIDGVLSAEFAPEETFTGSTVLSIIQEKISDTSSNMLDDFLVSSSSEEEDKASDDDKETKPVVEMKVPPSTTSSLAPVKSTGISTSTSTTTTTTPTTKTVTAPEPSKKSLSSSSSSSKKSKKVVSAEPVKKVPEVKDENKAPGEDVKANKSKASEASGKEPEEGDTADAEAEVEEEPEPDAEGSEVEAEGSEENEPEAEVDPEGSEENEPEAEVDPEGSEAEADGGKEPDAEGEAEAEGEEEGDEGEAEEGEAEAEGEEAEGEAEAEGEEGAEEGGEEDGKGDGEDTAEKDGAEEKWDDEEEAAEEEEEETNKIPQPPSHDGSDAEDVIIEPPVPEPKASASAEKAKAAEKAAAAEKLAAAERRAAEKAAAEAAERKAAAAAEKAAADKLAAEKKAAAERAAAEKEKEREREREREKAERAAAAKSSTKTTPVAEDPLFAILNSPLPSQPTQPAAKKQAQPEPTRTPAATPPTSSSSSSSSSSSTTKAAKKSSSSSLFDEGDEDDGADFLSPSSSSTSQKKTTPPPSTSSSSSTTAPTKSTTSAPAKKNTSTSLFGGDDDDTDDLFALIGKKS